MVLEEDIGYFIGNNKKILSNISLVIDLSNNFTQKSDNDILS
jgi:hypothetical protein